MSDLENLQRQMTAAIIAGDFSALAREFTAGGASAAARLGIHRNNTFLSLSEALKGSFPVTAELVDERFFAYAANRFIQAHPPGEARLAQYGGAFPRFLSRFPPCRDVPLAAEMASLEWAVAQANGAAVVPAADAAQLRSIGETGRLVLQPSLRFVLAHWPVDRIWLAHRRRTVDSEVPFARATCRLGLHRTGDGIEFIALGPGQFTFWRRLSRGRPVAEALAGAVAREPGFDLVTEILALFRRGLIAAPPSHPAIH